MKRPPLWVWTVPAAVAMGVLLGLRMRPPVPPAPAAHPAADTAPVAKQPLPVVPFPAVTHADPEFTDLFLDAAGWGVDGGVYRPLYGDAGGDTLPAAPEQAAPAPTAEPGAAKPAPRPSEGPAQGLAREAAYARPLVAAVRGGGRLSFYSAWHAPAARASLVGEWARVGSCGRSVRLGFEQPVAGLGAVRGAGEAAETPPWDVALVVARQHCAGAGAHWRGPRTPTHGERALLAPLFPGEPPVAVVADGERIWAASARRAVVARVAAGHAVERWSAAAPDGATIRLLGLWQGDGVWAAVESTGRVVRVWRITW